MVVARQKGQFSVRTKVGLYRIVNFAIRQEVDSVTVASLHCSLTIMYARFTTNVVCHSVIRDSAVSN